MDIQTIIVALIILLAIIYAGKMVYNKSKSFTKKSNCGNDCGCDENTPKVLAQIQRK